MKEYKNLVVFDHPLIRHKIAILRDEKTSMKEVRELVEEGNRIIEFEYDKDKYSNIYQILHEIGLMPLPP